MAALRRGAHQRLALGRGDDNPLPVVQDTAALTYLVNLASLELHVPQWRVDADDASRDNPDRLVIDLDPGSPAGLHECAQVALLVRERLERMGLTATPVTSRQQGNAAVCRAAGHLRTRPDPGYRAQIAQELTRCDPSSSCGR